MTVNCRHLLRCRAWSSATEDLNARCVTACAQARAAAAGATGCFAVTHACAHETAVCSPKQLTAARRQLQVLEATMTGTDVALESTTRQLSASHHMVGSPARPAQVAARPPPVPYSETDSDSDGLDPDLQAMLTSPAPAPTRRRYARAATGTTTVSAGLATLAGLSRYRHGTGAGGLGLDAETDGHKPSLPSHPQAAPSKPVPAAATTVDQAPRSPATHTAVPRGYAFAAAQDAGASPVRRPPGPSGGLGDYSANGSPNRAGHAPPPPALRPDSRREATARVGASQQVYWSAPSGNPVPAAWPGAAAPRRTAAPMPAAAASATSYREQPYADRVSDTGTRASWLSAAYQPYGKAAGTAGAGVTGAGVSSGDTSYSGARYNVAHPPTPSVPSASQPMPAYTAYLTGGSGWAQRRSGLDGGS